MFKCPNCHKMYMQYDLQRRMLVCYGSRCFQVIEVPRRILTNGVPSRMDLQECIDAFSRARRKR